MFCHCLLNIQGELEFYQNCMKNDDKVAEMIGNYRNHRAEIDTGGKPNQAFKVVEVKQKMSALESIRTSDNGEVMLRRRFLVWSTDRQTK